VTGLDGLEFQLNPDWWGGFPSLPEPN